MSNTNPVTPSYKPDQRYWSVLFITWWRSVLLQVPWHAKKIYLMNPQTKENDHVFTIKALHEYLITCTWSFHSSSFTTDVFIVHPPPFSLLLYLKEIRSLSIVLLPSTGNEWVWHKNTRLVTQIIIKTHLKLLKKYYSGRGWENKIAIFVVFPATVVN